MVVSKIIAEHYIYFNLHAEQVINSNYTENNFSGIDESKLSLSTILKIKKDLDNNIEKSSIKNIILDFKHICFCQPNIKLKFVELKASGFTICCINILSQTISELGFDAIQNAFNLENTEYDFFEKYYLFEEKNELTDLEISVSEIFKTKFKNLLKVHITEYAKPHTSSYVYINSYVDLKKFISYHKDFSLFAIYKLALKIKSEWFDELKENPILVCQSMNSSYVVSILSTLLKLDILILDKIGPINKLYSRLDNVINVNRKYIVVSDMVCLGTEVKIVKNLIQFVGGKYLGNVSLIKTETLTPKDIKKKDSTLAVFSITQENNRELNFSISTNLEYFTNE
jgi:hypothetical protein